MAYKNPNDLKRKPDRKSKNLSYRGKYNKPTSSSDNEIYSHSGDKAFNLNSMSNKNKKKKNRSRLIATNVILSILLAVATISFTVTSLLEANMRDPNIDSREDGDFEDLIGSDNPDVAYFLIVGVDLSDRLTDVIMLACYDLNNNTVNILQIPRDTHVGGTAGRINGVFGSPREGEAPIRALMRSVNYNFGMPVDNYVTVTIQGTENIIDALGGIEINLTQRFNLVDDSRRPTQRRTFNAGPTQLSGQWATALIRHRRSFRTADIGRLQNQRAVYAAILNRITNMSAGDLVNVARSGLNQISTDLVPGKALGFVQRSNGLDAADVRIMTVPGYTGMIGGRSMWIVRRQALVNMLNEYFRPYEETLMTVEDLGFPAVDTRDDTSFDEVTRGQDLAQFGATGGQ